MEHHNSDRQTVKREEQLEVCLHALLIAFTEAAASTREWPTDWRLAQTAAKNLLNHPVPDLDGEIGT